MINLKFCLISADQFVGKINPSPRGCWTGDWNFYSWAHMFRESFLCSFSYAVQHLKEIDEYDLIMFTAYPGNISELLTITNQTKAVTLWFPDGDTQVYFDNSMGGIRPQIIQAMNACSVFGLAEEDKKDFFEALLDVPVRFIHIAVPTELINGCFKNKSPKNNDILIFGDNNPNNPLVAMLVAKLTGKPIATTQIANHVLDLARSLGIKVSRSAGVQSQAAYLQNWVAPSRVMIYPTRWYGTARQVITGALCGTPVIGSRDSHTQIRLFPQLATNIHDVKGMAALVEQLYSDKNWYELCCEYAFEAVKFYSEENACRRMEEAYWTGKQRK